MVTREAALDKNPNNNLSFHLATRIGAKLVSYIFHPLFVPLYITFFLIYEVKIFYGLDAWDKTKICISVFVNYTFLPLMTILLMKGLGFIQSVYLKTQKDRILPYVVCQIFYFWGWYVSRNLAFPKPMIMFCLAVFIASSLGLIMNAYQKVSMHALSLGVASTLLFITGMMTSQNFGPYIAIALLTAGLTCTARLIDSNHTTKEVYAGFLAGVLSQLAAYLFV